MKERKYECHNSDAIAFARGLFSVCPGAGYIPETRWEYTLGAMYETENVEGQAEDMDGLYEPSVYFNAAYGPWVTWRCIRKAR